MHRALPPVRVPLVRAVALGACALLSAAALQGCGGGSGGSGSPQVRVLNALGLDAAATNANYDVLVNSASAVSNLGSAQASSFQAVPAASTLVQFEPTGTKTVVDSASFATQNGQDYTVVAIAGSAGLSNQVVAQTNASVASGQARLAFAHAAPATGSLDLFVSSPAAALPVAASVAALAYPGDGASAAPAALSVAAGDQRIRAIARGDATRTVVFDSGPLSTAAGDDLLLALVPASGSASEVSLLVATADSSVYRVRDQRVLLRVGNYAPGLGSVDAFLDASGTGNSTATQIAATLTAESASAYSRQLPGAYRLSLAASGQTLELLGSQTALSASTSLSAFAVGIAGQSAPYGRQLLLYTDDLRAPASGTARVRVLALAPDLAAVDLVLLDTSGTSPVIVRRLAVNLAYTGASTPIVLAPGSYAVALVPTGLDAPLLPSSAGAVLSVSDGGVYSLVIAGCRTPASGTCASATTALELLSLQDQ